MTDADVLEHLLAEAGPPEEPVQTRRPHGGGGVRTTDTERTLQLAERLRDRWSMNAYERLGIARAIAAGRAEGVAVLAFGTCERAQAFGYPSPPYPRLTERAEPGWRLYRGAEVVRELT